LFNRPCDGLGSNSRRIKPAHDLRKLIHKRAR